MESWKDPRNIRKGNALIKNDKVWREIFIPYIISWRYTMNYAQIRNFDTANGPGIRLTLFVSGCTNNCKNCFNKDYQDFNYGNEWTFEKENEFMELLKNPAISGVSILGGEPFQQDASLTNLLRKIKHTTDKSVWIYTGYTYDEAIKRVNGLNMMLSCDVLVDGRFVEELKDLKLVFRGSSNQRIIDVQKTIQTGEIQNIEF